MIKRLKESYAVTLLCNVFNVHRSSYKYWVNRSKTISPKKVKENVSRQLLCPVWRQLRWPVEDF